MSRRRFMRLSYLGAPYAGWQVQPGQTTVQGELERALGTLLRTPTPVTGAGRTDAGVNAHCMVAHFDTADGVDFDGRLLHSLNSMLGPAIAVHEVYDVRPDAHARFDATRRAYRYFVTTAKNPFARGLAWQAPPTLDFDAMNEAAALLLTVNDFTSFAKLHSDAKTNICRLESAAWHRIPADGALGEADALYVDGGHGEADAINRFPTSHCREMNSVGGDAWYFEIRADRFLRNMVRAVVGTLVDVGRGKIPPAAVLDVAARHDRCAAGTSMPGEPLFLWDIAYPADIRI